MQPSVRLTTSASATMADFGAESARPAPLRVYASPRQSPGAGARLATGLPATALTGVGIEPRRAHWVIQDRVTFPRAPLQSRKVGFPESGFGLGFPREAFPKQVRLKRSLAYTPTHFGCPLGSSFKAWLLRLTPLATRGPPSAQSSFAWHERYSCQGGVQHHLDEHYPVFIAPTSSCAKPAPSPGLHVSTLISGGPCRLLRTPAGNRFFPTLSLQVFPRMLEP